LEAAGFSPLLARLLALRGVSAQTAADWFAPSLRQLADPEEWPVVGRIADVILAFVRRGGPIVVFGDYDCDGVSATAILVKAIRALPGADVRAFLPERLAEGYGMQEASVARMRRENPDVALVVTVDNGIVSAGQVARLKAEGVAVIVTDHHLPGPVLPDCLVADPMADVPDALCPACFRGLCGAGVAFLVAHAVIARAKAQGLVDTSKSYAGEALVLAGLATVADVMPLTGQNRILVAEALRVFRRCAPIGLCELYDRASRRGVEHMTARDFGFIIGPRINAAGRLGSGMDALKLVLCSDREKARMQAREIDGRNQERKSTEQRMTDDALKKIVAGAAAQVVDLPDGHPGVAGIVAARVLESLEEQAVPVCVVVNGRGSARAPEGYNLRDALAECASLLDHFGGHAAAGGFSLPPDNTGAFRVAFAAACARQNKTGSAGVAVSFDAHVDGADLTLELAADIARMAPFGEGNPEPLFAARNLFLREVRPLGLEGRHLALTFRGDGFPRAVWWGHGDQVETLRANAAKPHEALFTVETSTYGGAHVELRIVALRPLQEV